MIISVLIFFESPTDIAGFVNRVRDEYIKAACDYIGEIFEEMDSMIRENGERKAKWEIVRRDTKTMLKSLGEIRYDKTLFKNKKTSERTYLLDKALKLEPNARMTEDAEALALKEACLSSYGRAGEAASLTGSISKTAVKNRLHELKIPEHTEVLKQKRSVKYLYIDADEDHVALQYLNDKGDTKTSDGENKHYSVLAKLVYVYEGIEAEAPASKRYGLINPHYFSGVYEGAENKILWENVFEYIQATYDIEDIERIYLNADGGGWIHSGKSRIPGIITVLDEHHLNKYLVSMTSHLFDSAEDGRIWLKNVIRNGCKTDFEECVEYLKTCTQDGAVAIRIDENSKYIIANWSAAKLRLRRSNGVVGSSTEGHVSHVLSSRMSSRPMDWSKKGADSMARLRAYFWNKGNMLELVRYQRHIEQPKSIEERYFSASQIRSWERQQAEAVGQYGKYYERINVSLPVQARKILAIKGHMVI